MHVSLAFEIEKYFGSLLENTSVDIINKGDFYAFERQCFVSGWNSNNICDMC